MWGGALLTSPCLLTLYCLCKIHRFLSQLSFLSYCDTRGQTPNTHNSIVHLSYILQGEVSFQNPLWRGTVTHGLPSWSVENSSQPGPCIVLPSRHCGWAQIGRHLGFIPHFRVCDYYLITLSAVTWKRPPSQIQFNPQKILRPFTSRAPCYQPPWR